MLFVSPNNPRPLYQQVVEQLRGLILGGDLAPGEALPSVRQLAADIDASVITTRRAYLELEREGLIVTRPGRGTFVAELDAEQRRRAAVAVLGQGLEALVAQAATLGLDAGELQALLKAIAERKR